MSHLCSQLRHLSYAILHSLTILLPLWYDTLHVLKLSITTMPHTIATCWNSTHNMLKFAVEYQTAIEMMVKEKALRCYELDDDEWAMVSQLMEILKVSRLFASLGMRADVRRCCLLSCQVYKHATLFFSHSTPSFLTVIPAMDHINDILTNQSLDWDNKFLPSIRTVCMLSKQTLNRYYNWTDEFENYCIAMSKFLIHC